MRSPLPPRAAGDPERHEPELQKDHNDDRAGGVIHAARKDNPTRMPPRPPYDDGRSGSARGIETAWESAPESSSRGWSGRVAPAPMRPTGAVAPLLGVQSLLPQCRRRRTPPAGCARPTGDPEQTSGQARPGGARRLRLRGFGSLDARSDTRRRRRITSSSPKWSERFASRPRCKAEPSRLPCRQHMFARPMNVTRRSTERWLKPRRRSLPAGAFGASRI
jgi:hypothetical protein